jgi:hypothetical protein
LKHDGGKNEEREESRDSSYKLSFIIAAQQYRDLASEVDRPHREGEQNERDHAVILLGVSSLVYSSRPVE